MSRVLNEYRMVEIRRLLLMVLTGLILGYITGHWLISQWVVSLLFIGWLLFKLYGLQNWLEKGQPAEYMPDSDGVWEQITAVMHRNKQTCDAHQQQQQDLLLRFNNIMAALPDAKVLLSADYRVQWSNQAALELLGLDNKRDVGQRVDNLIRAKKFSKLLKKKNKFGKSIRIKSPHNPSIALNVRFLFVQHGLYLLSVRNISQQVHLNTMRRAFIANASHELRTPLTVLSGYLELFDDDPELSAHLKPAIEQAREQGVRMQQIISDMLKLSKLESSEYGAALETTIDMPDLIQSISADLQKTIAANTHQLTVHIDAPLKINGVDKDIASVITNLLGNAIKHTPTGSHIKVSWQQGADDSVNFSVEDDGAGIPAQHLEHLTERFYRVDKGRSRDKGGTGLGLAIVKHIMLNHNGTLKISSVPGRTVFTAQFPAERIIT